MPIEAIPPPPTSTIYPRAVNIIKQLQETIQTRTGIDNVINYSQFASTIENYRARDAKGIKKIIADAEKLQRILVVQPTRRARLRHKAYTMDKVVTIAHYFNLRGLIAAAIQLGISIDSYQKKPLLEVAIYLQGAMVIQDLIAAGGSKVYQGKSANEWIQMAIEEGKPRSAIALLPAGYHATNLDQKLLGHAIMAYCPQEDIENQVSYILSREDAGKFTKIGAPHLVNTRYTLEDKKNYLKLIKLLVQHINPNGVFALHLAILRRGDPALIDILIDDGKADINLPDTSLCTPLQYAILADNRGIVATLIKNVDLNDNGVLLSFALINNCHKAFQMLLTKGATPSPNLNLLHKIMDKKYYNPISLVALLRMEGDINTFGTKNHTPLIAGIITENTAGCKFLIENFHNIASQEGITLDINRTMQQGISPLHAAVIVGNISITALLIQHGAAVNTVGKDGGKFWKKTPLHTAICRYLKTPNTDPQRKEMYKDIMGALLRAGALIETHMIPKRWPFWPTKAALRGFLLHQQEEQQRRLGKSLFSPQ